MRFALSILTVGIVAAVSAAPAHAFGRGAAFRGAAVGPAGGVRTGGFAGGTAVGPLGGVRSGQVRGGTYTGPGGTTVQHIGGRGASVGPLGGVRVGGGGATRVTGPAGNTAVTGHRGGAAIGPAGNVYAGGSRGGAIATPWGTSAGIQRGGVAIGPGGAFAGGTRVVGHTTGYVSPYVMRSSGVAVRTGGYYPYFNRTWYTTHAAAWVAPRWVVGYNVWAPPVWNTLVTFCNIPVATPVTYDYGGTVVINDNSVYINGDSAGTAEEYATQATTIADTGREAKPAEGDEWQPLGVFGLIQADDKVAQRIFQLAINKDGVIRGNYYDAVADSTTPVYGSLDKKSQRAAWSIGEKKDIVFETGLSNLTKQESTVLIHYGKDRTDQQMLVRLEEPKDKK